MAVKLFSPRWYYQIQKFVLMKYMFIFLVLPFLSLAIFGYVLCMTQLWWTMLLYTAWLYMDWDVAERGGRPSNWYRRLWIWKAMADFFPNQVVVTENVPADRNYIFGWHPHGIITVSAFTNFCTNGTGLDEKMPGIRRYMATLASQFYYPFRREIVAALGVIGSSREALSAVLSRQGGGNAVGLVIGGAEEAMESHPDRFSLNLLNRKGFVKLALRTGASLVPVYTFGETHMFHQLDNNRGTPLRDFQSVFKARVGVSPVLFHGESLWSDSVGMLPQQRPLLTVSKFRRPQPNQSTVGKPVHVQQVESPSQEHIDALHNQYLDSLVKLFEDHKHLYNVPKDAHLHFY